MDGETKKILKQDDLKALDAEKDSLQVPDPGSLPSLEGKVSEEEWRLRCDLAALYRLSALYGWDDMIFTHISVRCPDEGGEPRFLMNPYGVMFDEMTASSLIKVDVNGELVAETPYIANPAGFTIHSAVHMARHDATCVIHLHSMHGVAVSAQKAGLRRLTQFAMIVHDDVAYHDYEGIALNLEERERIIADMGEKSFLILKNHGTLTVGGSCGAAFLRMYFLEQACKAQILALSAGPDGVHEDTTQMAALVGKQGAAAFVPGLGDALAWPGLLRKLAKASPGWER